MNDSDVQAFQYQFSGYNLPMLQLDSTGPAYIWIPKPPPYYSDQPSDWTKPAYYGIQGNITSDNDFLSNPLYPMAPFEKDPIA